jgi:hypothetical protein
MPQHTFADRYVDRADPFIAMTRSLRDESSTLSKRTRKSQVSSKLLASTGQIIIIILTPAKDPYRNTTRNVIETNSILPRKEKLIESSETKSLI